jgi:predicted ATPase
VPFEVQVTIGCVARFVRYPLWAAALLSPRPPQLMVLNEPETNLHPDLLLALARLILAAPGQAQIIVVSHAPQLIKVLTVASMCVRLHLVKELGERTLEGATLFNKPKWVWPAR